MGGYGYSSRPDGPEKQVRVPPQAVPISALPYKVANAVKNPPVASATLKQLVSLCVTDVSTVRLLGNITPSNTSEGGAGVTTITEEKWWSDISRWCRYVDVHHTGAANDKRVSRLGQAFEFSPLAFLDPSKAEAPFILRFEDVVAARLVTPGASDKGGFYFGLTWQNAVGVALAAPKPFIGIYAQWTGTAYGTWYARCVDDSGSGLDQSLGISTEHPHSLCYGLDGRGQVVFSIDNEDLLTYDTTGSDLATNTIFSIEHRWGTEADNGATIRVGYMMDMQSLVSVEVLDEVA